MPFKVSFFGRGTQGRFKANEKIKDLYANYSRAATLVVETLNSMMEADEAIAQQIIDKLGV